MKESDKQSEGERENDEKTNTLRQAINLVNAKHNFISSVTGDQQLLCCTFLINSK